MPLVALVEAIAAKQPTVLWVQDLHWADPSTLALLRRLPPLVSAPVLIVVNYRLESCPASARSGSSSISHR
jgi:predicted ATPase